LEAWRLSKDGRTIAGELIIQAMGSACEVVMKIDDELRFGRRCADMQLAVSVLDGLLRDHRRAGWKCARCLGERFICEQHPHRPWPHEECTGPEHPCPQCNARELTR